MKPRPRRSSSNRKRKSYNEDSSSDSKGGSDSDWGDGGEVPSSSSEDEIFEEEEEEEPPKKKTPSSAKKRTTKSPAKKRKRVEYPSSSDEEALILPTSVRQTARGGYAHTNKSKARISRANRGNVPWNKQKGWSEEIKAKISAGVKARNRAILLVKLKKLGMSEEEYLAKKKKIKVLRERVRKAKVAAAKYEQELEKLKAKQQQTGEDVPSEPESEEEETVEETPEETAEETTQDAAPGEQSVVAPMFSRMIKWSPHDYDKGFYQEACPVGGPGGLICCNSCVAAYSQYMIQTARDMEQQTSASIQTEIKELVGFLSEARTQLEQAVQAARGKPIRKIVRRETTSTTGNQSASDSAPTNVNWTTTMGDVGAFAKV